MIELLFLMGFTLHNIEEAIWMPKWSKHAKKYHKEVTANEFIFAVIIITAIGYLFTFQYFIFSDKYIISKYLYLGFILMMVVNVLIPHLVSSIKLKRYCPGTLTGILLNLPIGLYLLITKINSTNELLNVVISFIIIVFITLLLIKYLFVLGKTLFDY